MEKAICGFYVIVKEAIRVVAVTVDSRSLLDTIIKFETDMDDINEAAEKIKNKVSIKKGRIGSQEKGLRIQDTYCL